MNPNYIKKLSLTKTRECIQRFKKLDTKQVSIDQIKNLIKPLWVGYSLTSPILRPGNIFYRAVKWYERPTKITQLSYPPQELIKRDQRANRAGKPRFYACNSRPAIFFEVDMQSGEHVAVSKWRTKDSIIINSVAYTIDVFNTYQSKRKINDLSWAKTGSNNNTSTNELIHKFFAKEFSKKVSENSEHLYKISIAIAEGLFGEEMQLAGELLIENPPIERRLVGLLYPTLAMLANSDNLVLLPEIADKYLEFQSVEYIRVDKSYPDHKYDITLLDFANSINSNGIIEWKGRLPQWNIDSASSLSFSVENNQWVARNTKGEVIDPT